MASRMATMMVWSDEGVDLNQPTFANMGSRVWSEWLSIGNWKDVWIMALDIRECLGYQGCVAMRLTMTVRTLIISNELNELGEGSRLQFKHPEAQRLKQWSIN
jgi:hypothetical protein